MYHLSPKTVHFLLLLLSLLLLHSPVKAQFIFRSCQSTTNSSAGSQTDPKFQTDSSQLLSPLITNGALNGFYNTTTGQIPNQLYGLLLCRGDMFSHECQTCLNNATAELVRDCPNRNNSFIWFETCYIRYSDKYFFGTYKNHSTGGSKTNLTKQEDADIDARAFMNKLVSRVSSAPQRVWPAPLLCSTDVLIVSGNRRRYGMVQCSSDLGREDCEICLADQMSTFWKSVEGAGGWQIYGESCALWYQAYPFIFESSELTPTATQEPAFHAAPKPSFGLDGNNGLIRQPPRTVMMAGSILAVWGLLYRLHG